MCWRIVYKGADGDRSYGGWFCDFDLLRCWIRDQNQKILMPHSIESCEAVGLPCILQGCDVATTSAKAGAASAVGPSCARTAEKAGAAIAAGPSSASMAEEAGAALVVEASSACTRPAATNAQNVLSPP